MTIIEESKMQDRSFCDGCPVRRSCSMDINKCGYFVRFNEKNQEEKLRVENEVKEKDDQLN